MLVPFAIDVDALTGEERWTDRDLREYHESLLIAWKRIGLFVFDGQHLSSSVLRRAIDAIHEGSVMHGLWRGFIDRAPAIPGGDRWSGTISNEVIPSLAEVARVCFTNDASRDQFETVAKETNIELLTIAGAGRCEGFATGERRAAEAITPGNSVRSVWVDRFGSLAAARTDKLKNISIVDPYAIERHINDGKEGLARFLSLLSESAQSRKNVTVYAKLPYRNGSRVSNKEIVESLQGMRQQWRLESISKLTVVLGRNSEQYPRERFIMFGETYVWSIGHVLEVFDATIVTNTHDAALKCWGAAESYGVWLDGLQVHDRLEIW